MPLDVPFIGVEQKADQGTFVVDLTVGRYDHPWSVGCHTGVRLPQGQTRTDAEQGNYHDAT